MIVGSHGIIGSSIGQFVPDSDAQAFFQRVADANGTLSATEKTAVNTLVVQMKFDGIWNSMKAIYPMVGASDAACKQNLKSSSFTGSFSSGWTFASKGVKGDGISAFMNTNFNPSINMINDSASMAVYNRTINPNNGRHGLRDNAGGTELICKIGTVAFPIINVGSNFGGFSFTSNGQGFIQAIRTSATRIVGLQNSSLFIGSQNQYRMNANFLISASNVLGTTPLNFSNQEIAFFSLGDGLTDAEAGLFYTAVQNFNTTLLRQV